MAKKPAPKKKVVKVVTSKAAKSAATKNTSSKSSAKVATKPVSKAVKPIKKVETAKPMVKASAVKPTKIVEVKETLKAKPALMTKKGKAVEVEEVDQPVVTKAQTVVAMLESDAQTSEEPAKAEKVSKVKPVKIERGNAADEKAKWAELNKKYGKDKAVTYKMSEKFESMVPMQHKVLGWGFILSNENDRLEVLFETGIRMLISNYKA